MLSLCPATLVPSFYRKTVARMENGDGVYNHIDNSRTLRDVMAQSWKARQFFFCFRHLRLFHVSFHPFCLTSHLAVRSSVHVTIRCLVCQSYAYNHLIPHERSGKLFEFCDLSLPTG